MPSPFPNPQGGASLLLSFRLKSTQTVLILGSGQLAANRAFTALEADASVIVLANGGLDSACEELQYRAKEGQVEILDWNGLPGSSNVVQDTEDWEAKALDAYLSTNGRNFSFICITETLVDGSSTHRSRASAERIQQICKARGILVNVADTPDLSDFSFTATHRFEANDKKTPLQIAVTTNGQGCRLAGRIKREIISQLPRDIGTAVEKIGKLRGLAKEDDGYFVDKEIEGEGLCEDSGISTPNRPVPVWVKTDQETQIERARRRMKWVAQVSEYWPLSRLVTMSQEEMVGVLSGEFIKTTVTGDSPPPISQHELSLTASRPRGKILLVGSGPGHPSLLTLATHTALTQRADLVLSDKLVPSAVLDLIPSHVTVRIARKFPGNAEGAQMEMMEAAIEAANQGLTVVRLKQGDPIVYGRAGEEVLYFRERGFESIVIPGVSSALAAPTFAGIPVTQRGVAESFIVCTGVGRSGKSVQLPGYQRSRTLIVLMGVARLTQVINTLVNPDIEDGRQGPVYPKHTPIAIIERASMPDQRVTASTLGDIVAALETAGEQRPPGMFVIGWAALALWKEGDVRVLEEEENLERDEARVKRWLGNENRWRIIEGLDAGWEGL